MVDVILQDLLVHDIQSIDLDELSQKTDNIEDDVDFGLVSVGGEST